MDEKNELSLDEVKIAFLTAVFWEQFMQDSFIEALNEMDN